MNIEPQNTPEITGSDLDPQNIGEAPSDAQPKDDLETPQDREAMYRLVHKRQDQTRGTDAYQSAFGRS